MSCFARRGSSRRSVRCFRSSSASMSTPYLGSDMSQPTLVNTRVAVVTGANKGIGLEVAVSRATPSSGSSQMPCVIDRD